MKQFIDKLIGIVYIVIVNNEINMKVSYSEWWRYKGSVKPRQPLSYEGRCQPERVCRTIRGFDYRVIIVSPLMFVSGLFDSFKNNNTNRKEKRLWKNYYLLQSQ